MRAKSQVCIHKPECLKRKESRSGSNRGPSAYQPSALPTRPNRLTFHPTRWSQNTKENKLSRGEGERVSNETSVTTKFRKKSATGIITRKSRTFHGYDEILHLVAAYFHTPGPSCGARHSSLMISCLTPSPCYSAQTQPLFTSLYPSIAFPFPRVTHLGTNEGLLGKGDNAARVCVCPRPPVWWMLFTTSFRGTRFPGWKGGVFT